MAIKYTSIDIVVFDYITFPIFTNTTGMTHFLDSEREFVALDIQHWKCMDHVVVCDLPVSTIFLQIIS